MRKNSLSALVGAVLVILLLYNSCGEGFSTQALNTNLSVSSVEGSSVFPDQLDSNFDSLGEFEPPGEEGPSGNDDPKEESPAREELWLKIGQSNAVGWDGAGELLPTDRPDPRLFELSKSGKIIPHGVTAADDHGGIGPGLQFGNDRLAKHPEIKKLVIVHRAIGGTGFSDRIWIPQGKGYVEALKGALQALESNPNLKFAGFLWHQGESDAIRPPAEYQKNLTTMVESLRASIPGANHAPFICATLLQSWVDSNRMTRSNSNEVLKRVSEFLPNAHCVDMSDVTEAIDHVHFSSAGLRILGSRWADAAEQMRK